MESLRTLADKCGLHIGTCANHQHLANDAAYMQTMAREFNSITCENELKFRSLCPAKAEYNFEPADNLVAFAERHNMLFRGHVLVWDDQLPAWLIKAGYSRSELIEILQEHIYTVVSRYAGRIHTWDVVNEAVDHNGELKQTFWYNGIGPEFIEMAFHAAKKADPSAKLFYNDQGCEARPEHHNGVYKLLKNLKQKDVPVDGIGFQMHLSLEDFDKQYMNVERLQDLGLEIDITELDVRMQMNQQDLQEQAQVYADIFQHFIKDKGCTSLTLWGFTDKYSWIPFFYPTEGGATIMTDNFSPKPAYRALAKQFESLIQSNSSWQSLHSSVQSPGRVLK